MKSLFLVVLLFLVSFTGCGETGIIDQSILREYQTEIVSQSIPNSLYDQLFPLDTLAFIFGKEIDREIQKAYYTRYIEADGIVIIGSEEVTEDEFRIARGIVLDMTAKHPILRKHLTPGFKIVIIAEGKTLLDLPEYDHLEFENLPYHGLFAGASGFYSPLSKFGYGSFVHEMGHAILFAIEKIEPDIWGKIEMLWENAIKAGKYKGDYAATAPSEYFAECVKWWFLGGDPDIFRSRQEMEAYDPEIYAVLAEWLPETNLTLP